MFSTFAAFSGLPAVAQGRRLPDQQIRSGRLAPRYAPNMPRGGVTALCPGFVRTPLLETFATGSPGQRRHDIPLWLCASPENGRCRCHRAIRRNKGSVVITPMARLLWWIARLSPGLLDWVTRQGWRGKRRKGDV